MKVRMLLAGSVVIGLAAGGAWLASALARPIPVTQPMPFNHQVHVKGQEMACIDCHAGNEQARSGFSDIRSCYECHKEVQGDKPSEEQEKVREYGKAKRQIPWVAVHRLPGHVYFSHRAHVAFANIKCEDCHGDVGDRTEAVALPSPGLLSMSHCLDCHRERGASLQCITCHK